MTATRVIRVQEAMEAVQDAIVYHSDGAVLEIWRAEQDGRKADPERDLAAVGLLVDALAALTTPTVAADYRAMVEERSLLRAVTA